MRRNRPQTVLEVALQNVGFLKASDALSFVLEWSTPSTIDRSDNITRQVEAYADYWKLSRSQAFRRLELFRRAFPGYSTPFEMIDHGVAVREARREAKSGDRLGSLLAFGAQPWVEP